MHLTHWITGGHILLPKATESFNSHGSMNRKQKKRKKKNGGKQQDNIFKCQTEEKKKKKETIFIDLLFQLCYIKMHRLTYILSTMLWKKTLLSFNISNL